MEFIEAIILGIIQGITEWLPISSEGINSLVLIKFFGKDLSTAVFYSLWLHTGTLIASIVYFRKDIGKILHSFRTEFTDKKYALLGKFIILSTIFTLFIGVPIILFGLSEINFSGQYAIAFIGLLLVITGIIQKMAKKRRLKKTIRLGDSTLVGFLQGFAALPGISRSGITTSLLLLRKYDSSLAIKTSFLMSIPVVFLAALGTLVLGKVALDLASLLAVVISFVLGFLTIKLLLKLAEKIDFSYFCIFLGILAVLGILF